MILAIDTSHDFGSLALLANGELLEETPLVSADGFAHILFQSIEALLARHGVALPHIDAFACAQGPGSFTGLRVALTAVKGLAEARNKPAFGVSNLQALASSGRTPVRAPFYDARRGDVYAAFPDGTEHVLNYPDFLSLIPPHAELISFDFSAFPAQEHPRTLAPRCLAAAVARLAQERFSLGERPDPALLDANYVRRSDAELHWREA